MARLSIYVSDDLLAQVRDVAGRVNVSALTQAALRRLLACEHDDLRCATCDEPIDALDLRDEWVGAYYAEPFRRAGGRRAVADRDLVIAHRAATFPRPTSTSGNLPVTPPPFSVESQ